MSACWVKKMNVIFFATAPPRTNADPVELKEPEGYGPDLPTVELMGPSLLWFLRSFGTALII